MSKRPEKHEVVRQRLLRRTRKIINELRQIVADKEWWNEHRTDCEPFDVGADRVALVAHEKMLPYIERDERIPDDVVRRRELSMEGLIKLQEDDA